MASSHDKTRDLEVTNYIQKSIRYTSEEDLSCFNCPNVTSTEKKIRGHGTGVWNKAPTDGGCALQYSCSYAIVLKMYTEVSYVQFWPSHLT